MSAAADLSALSVAAAQAASAGDTAGAIDLLRQLLALQSQHLGADHADRATTLNNLALLLERQGQVDEAGACYRDAYEIAHRALGADDPMVQISRANLVAFLRGQGITTHELLGPAGGLHDFAAEGGAPAPASPTPPPQSAPAVAAGSATTTPEPAADLPLREPPPMVRTAPRAAPPAPVARPVPAGASPATAPRTSVATPTPATVAPPAGSRTPLAWIAAGLIVLGAAGWMFSNAGSPAPAATPDAAAPAAPATGQEAPSSPVVAPQDAGAASPEARVASQAPASDAPPSAAPDAATTPSREAVDSAPSPRDGDAGASVPVVTEARVCDQLRTGGAVWACQPVAADSDTASYYTRIRSDRRLTVHHVWLRDGREVHRASLRIDANAREGYRTYSRQRLTPGSWQVRVMDAAGSVLEEDAFEIR